MTTSLLELLIATKNLPDLKIFLTIKQLVLTILSVFKAKCLLYSKFCLDLRHFEYKPGIVYFAFDFSDDAQLLKFLRGCKFSLERTKEKLDLYNACRANVPNWFSCWDVESSLFQKFLGWG